MRTSRHNAAPFNQKINDHGQLRYAAEYGRAILTYNNRDFVPLDVRWKRQGRTQASYAMPVYSHSASCCAA